jgi:Ca2+/Na+ antiporter
VLYLICTGYAGIYQQEWVHEHLNPMVNIDSLPMFIFFIVFAILAVLSFTKNFSLIPVLGMVTCLYLMAQIHLKNWIGFSIWLIAGLVIYFGFSYKNSKLAKQEKSLS